MRTPTQKQWQTVIDNLYSILPFTLENKNHLDMLETHVNINHVCGTAHCVGGWYAIAKYKDEAFSTSLDESFVYLYYGDGTRLLAKDLGFSDVWELQYWAEDNPEIWGNAQGHNMFSSAHAYNHGKGRANSIEDVIHHFEFVKDKCAGL